MKTPHRNKKGQFAKKGTHTIDGDLVVKGTVSSTAFTALDPRPPELIKVGISGKHQLPREAPPMPVTPTKKPWYKSKTVLGIVMFVVGWGLGLIGVDPDIIKDGIQFDDVVVILGALIALYGRKVANQPLGT